MRDEDFERLEAMAENDGTWDFSPNDVVALKMCVSEILHLRAENARLREALVALVDAVDALAGDSEGVGGLHMNGDLAPWNELLPGGQFEEWLKPLESARAVLDTPLTQEKR